MSALRPSHVDGVLPGTAQGNNKKDSGLLYNEEVSFHRREIGNQDGKGGPWVINMYVFQVILDLIEFNSIYVIRKKRSSPTQ